MKKRISILLVTLLLVFISVPNGNFLGENKKVQHPIVELNPEIYTSVSESFDYNETWGGGGIDNGYGVTIDSNEYIYITGETDSYGAGGYDAFLAKYDNAGNLQWNKTWGGSSDEVAKGIVMDEDDNIFISGHTWSFGPNPIDAFIIKYNSSGGKKWNKTWGGTNQDTVRDIGIDNSGNLYITGYTDSFGDPDGDMFLVKFNSSGMEEWNTTWGGSLTEAGHSIFLQDPNNIYITGRTSSLGDPNGDLFLIKYNSSGEKQWNSTWGGEGIDQGDDLMVDGRDFIYVTGKTKSFGTLNEDLLLIKFNRTGGIEWNITAGGFNNDAGDAIALDDSNNIFIAGYTESFGVGNKDLYLLRYDHAGDLKWNKTWGGINDDASRDIALGDSNNLYITGYTGSFGSGNKDAVIAKYKTSRDDGIGALLLLNQPEPIRISGYLYLPFILAIIAIISIMIQKTKKKLF
jgi:uncharacterized delta-60 repeat protein